MCATWGPPRVGGGVWSRWEGGWGALGWPPMPGVGLGVICIETAPKPGRCGGASRERAGRGPRLPGAPSPSIRHVLCPGLAGVSLPPSSGPVAPCPPAASAACCWGPCRPPRASLPSLANTVLEVAVGARVERRPHWVPCPVGLARAPGCAHLVLGGGGRGWASLTGSSSSERR